MAERAIEAAEQAGFLPLVVVGGVARNRRLREVLEKRASRMGGQVIVPAPNLCTDNGAMVAAAGAHKFAFAGADNVDLDCAANLPLESWSKPDSP